MNLVQTLSDLCQVPAVTGFERAGAEAVVSLLAPLVDEVRIDKVGSVIGLRRCGRENARTVLLDAHLDQIGFVVTEVLDGGFLRFAPVGGIDPRMLLGGEVDILTDEPLYGVISCTPPHLMKPGEEDKAVPIHEMLIDTGLLDAKTRVKVGTPIVFRQKMLQLSGDSITGKCLDDRAGVVSILYALEKLKETDLAVDLAVLISVQEETSSLGAIAGGYALRPDYAIAVDVTHAKSPDAPDEFEYGGGVAIGLGPNLNTALSKALIRTAKAEGMDYQLEVMEGFTGTNAWDLQIAGTGAATALLSIPLRYMHTPIETIKLSDLESVGDLIYHFLRTFDGEVRL
ncbi:MAG: M42 family metallopeptidase [Butyricicoccus sp.]